MSGSSFVAPSLFVLSLGMIWGLRNCRSSPVLTVSSLHIYPIKSCGGISIESSLVTKRGLQYDRMFMVVDENGNFLTQRKKPAMALIQTSIDHERGILIISAPNMPILEVSLSEGSNETLQQVTVWKDKCDARIVPTNGWFAQYLGIPGLQLARFADNYTRPSDPEFAPKGQTGFADGFAFLLASDGSIDEIQRLASTEDTLLRFRPNITVNGCTAFAEDSWKSIVFGKNPSWKANVVKPCSRCTMPDVDPKTGVYEKEMKVTRVLQKFRKGEDLNLSIEKWKKQLFFGQNLDHEGQENITLSVGDVVRVA